MSAASHHFFLYKFKCILRKVTCGCTFLAISPAEYQLCYAAKVADMQIQLRSHDCDMSLSRHKFHWRNRHLLFIIFYLILASSNSSRMESGWVLWPETSAFPTCPCCLTTIQTLSVCIHKSQWSCWEPVEYMSLTDTWLGGTNQGWHSSSTSDITCGWSSSASEYISAPVAPSSVFEAIWKKLWRSHSASWLSNL